MKGRDNMKKLSLVIAVLAIGAVLSVLPAQAQEKVDPFAPDITFPICLDFDNFCDGIEMSNIAADNMVVAAWKGYDCAGTDGPMLGGFTKGPPRRAYIMGDKGVLAPGDIFVFTFEVDLGTFDLWHQDSSGSLTQSLDDEPYTASLGACPFSADTKLPASTAGQ